MKVFAYVYAVVDDNGYSKHDSVVEIYETDKAAIEAAINRGYVEDSDHRTLYNEFCIWMSKIKEYENTEGGGVVYIMPYEVLKA